ncbi:cell division protein ZapE [Breoghania corrubedonensis]|uniref:Cell division protein ZapE n=1 Tax=Breoghania corrubedonensis TaxID=665038 RepID=A0A2T5VGT3_9HYPH|nr:cell division protein ZapE [Breoghania corrubedonensis]PTW62959.1 cell division protein ZapE [Breoghania corrubedonensis]
MPASQSLSPNVRERYEAMVTAGELDADPAQRAIIDKLDALNEALAERRLASKHSPLGWLFGKKQPKEPLKGLYVWGSVGRGKTMLMDLFFEHAVVKRKRRAHFHEFMNDAHERIHAVRQKIKAGTIKGSDPIAPVAAELAQETRLLCFDEFSVTDIADAMLLGRLFEKLFDAGVVVVATSNVDPDDLYRDGLNRDHFVPFIKLLKRQVEVFNLDSPTDYRLEKLAGAPVYISPLGEAADREMERIWKALTQGTKPRSDRLEVKGRWIEVPQTACGVARFSFHDLCERPYSAADYLRVAHAYHTVMVERVPVLQQNRRNEAKRFINLIDALYDQRIKLVISAESEPDGLYVATSGTEKFEFDRTISRLTEMRSQEYLAEVAR